MREARAHSPMPLLRAPLPRMCSTLPQANILCLHGGGTNEAIMRIQTAKLRAALKPSAAFHFLEGTVPSSAVDPSVKARFADQNFYSWYDVEYDRETSSIEEYRDALLDPSVSFRYPGADAAIERLEQHIATVKPDALLGFSQGAILITMLTALRLQPGATPPSWRANILVAGMPVRADSFASLCGEGAPPLRFPTLIAQGTEDPFYEWCRRLERSYDAPELFNYDEGHRFPHKRDSNKALAESVRRLLL